MRVLRVADRPRGEARLEGAMEETPLLRVGDPSGAGSSGSAEEWELIFARADAGAAVLPVPFPAEEVGYVVQGRVELTELPADYGFEEDPTEQIYTHVLATGDAFHIVRGDRVMIDVIEDLIFLLWRRVRPEDPDPPPPCMCA